MLSFLLMCINRVHRLTQEQLMQASQVATEQLHNMLDRQSEMWTEREERDKEMRAQHEEMLQNLWIKAEEREKEMLKLTKVRFGHAIFSYCYFTSLIITYIPLFLLTWNNRMSKRLPKR